jgi:alkylation response protein AidB-like acyl-CoA dehydrogenase
MALDRADRQAWREANRAFIARSYSVSDLRAGLDEPRVLDRGAWVEACELGWLAAQIDSDHGGLDAGLDVMVDLCEELARGLVGAPFFSNTLSLSVIINDPELLSAVSLDELLGGSRCAAWCVADSDYACTAEDVVLELTANEGRQLTGVKQYVLDADLADGFVVSVRDGGQLRNLWVPANTPGVTVTTLGSLDLTRPVSTVAFDRVPVAPPGPSWDQAASRAAIDRGLQLGGLLVSADAIGAADLLMEATVAYVQQREVFGTALANYQAVKHKCADMLCAVEGSREAALAAAKALDSSGPDDADAAIAAARAVHVAKAFAGDQCSRVAGEALQLHGGIGFTWEHDLHLYLRRIKADEMLFGSVRRHRDALGQQTILAAQAN